MTVLGDITAFLATTQPGRAREFYEETLGLSFVSEDDFAIVFECSGTHLRIQKVPELTPHPFTSLGWHVHDIAATVRELKGKGVAFERYSFVEQDEDDIWTAPSTTMVAWFRDPDGNLLSLSQ